MITSRKRNLSLRCYCLHSSTSVHDCGKRKSSWWHWIWILLQDAVLCCSWKKKKERKKKKKRFRTCTSLTFTWWKWIKCIFTPPTTPRHLNMKVSWGTCAYWRTKVGGIQCKMSLKKKVIWCRLQKYGIFLVWTPQKGGHSVCKNAISSQNLQISR